MVKTSDFRLLYKCYVLGYSCVYRRKYDGAKAIQDFMRILLYTYSMYFVII